MKLSKLSTIIGIGAAAGVACEWAARASPIVITWSARHDDGTRARRRRSDRGEVEVDAAVGRFSPLDPIDRGELLEFEISLSSLDETQRQFSTRAHY